VRSRGRGPARRRPRCAGAGSALHRGRPRALRCRHRLGRGALRPGRHPRAGDERAPHLLVREGVDRAPPRLRGSAGVRRRRERRPDRRPDRRGGTMTYRILTICTGNICRSPMVEFAVREALEQAGLGDRVEVASAGTSGWEVGNPIDPRAGALLSRHGLSTDAHRARQMDDAELQAADLVLTLDHDHVAPVRRALGPARAEQTVRMVRDFAPHAVEDTGIRDPWYGDESGFDTAWEQI